MSRGYSSGGGLAKLAMCALLSGAFGCQGSEDVGSATFELNAPHDIITSWNARGITACLAATDVVRCSRIISMAHLAAHDALNGVRPKYAQYHSSLSDHDASPTAAAAAAMHGVLAASFPTQAAALDAFLASSLAGESGEATDRGVALGHAVAAEMMALRANDGINSTYPYTPINEPGHYQFTPGVVALFVPQWGQVTPFFLTSSSQFRSPPPPELTSAEYTAIFNEVKEYGRTVSSVRTADQTAYAHFWYESSTFGWSRATRNIVAEHNWNLWKAARLYALVEASMADGYICGVESKRFYDFWRPYTAIRAADTDGNPDTIAELDWTSLRAAPPVQEHPSTHSVVGAAGARAIVDAMGSDFGFSMTSPTSIPANSDLRSYDSVLYAAWENSDSRVAAGIHFRSATDDGVTMGDQIGSWAVANYLQALDE